MTDETPEETEDTEETKTGLSVPIPKRGKFFENLKKATEPDKESDPRSPGK